MGRDERRDCRESPGLRGDDSGEATTARSTPPEHPGKGITNVLLALREHAPEWPILQPLRQDRPQPAALLAGCVPGGRRADAAARPGHRSRRRRRTMTQGLPVVCHPEQPVRQASTVSASATTPMTLRRRSWPRSSALRHGPGARRTWATVRSRGTLPLDRAATIGLTTTEAHRVRCTIRRTPGEGTDVKVDGSDTRPDAVARGRATHDLASDSDRAPRRAPS